mmetsp:Transcript_44336/g.147001  ORF Transcript_44336/g.147001 Transcript_44336/m.147001 type:complete len:578 (+) Transcript_44336:768-2501(+)
MAEPSSVRRPEGHVPDMSRACLGQVRAAVGEAADQQREVAEPVRLLAVRAAPGPPLGRLEGHHHQRRRPLGRPHGEHARADAPRRLSLRREVVWEGGGVPAAEGVADVDVAKPHHEFGVVDPEGAVVHSRAIEPVASSAASRSLVGRQPVVAVLCAVLRAAPVAGGAVGAQRQSGGAGGGRGAASALDASDELGPLVGRVAPIAVPLCAAVRVAHSQQADHLARAGGRLPHVEDRVGVPADEADLPQVAPLGVVRAAPHWQLERRVSLESSPRRLRVEAGVAEVLHLGGRAGQVEKGLGHPAAGDGLVRAVRLGVRLLDQRRPQLLLAARGPAAAKGELCVEGEVVSPRRRRHRQLVVDPDRRPRAVEEEAQAVAAGRVARRVGGEDAGDQVVPLGNDGEGAHEPAVADAALPQVLGAEAGVADDVQLERQPRPAQLCGAAAAPEGHLSAVGPRKEAALAGRAVKVPPPLVWRILAHGRGRRLHAAAALGGLASRHGRRRRRPRLLVRLVLSPDRQLRRRVVAVHKLRACLQVAVHRGTPRGRLGRGQRRVVAVQEELAVRGGGARPLGGRREQRRP